VNIKRLVGLVMAALFMPAAAMAQQVYLYNPNGREVSAVGTVEASAAGIQTGRSYIAVDTESGRQYPLQLQGGELFISAKLAPFEGKVLKIKPGKPIAGEPVVSAVKQQDGSIRLENAYYSVLLDASKGYTITKIIDKERREKLRASFGDLILRRKTVRRGQAFPDPGSIRQSQVKVNCTIEQDGPYLARLILNWSSKEGEVHEVITAYAVSRVIEYSYFVKTAAPLDYVMVGLDAHRYGSKAIIMPDGERVSGTSARQRYRLAPCRVVGFDPEGKKTLGILTSPDSKGTIGIYLWDRPEGARNNAFGAHYYSRYLAHKPIGTEVKFALGLLIGGGRDVLASLNREVGDKFVLESGGKTVVKSLGTAMPWGIVGKEMTFKPVIIGNPEQVRLSIDGEAVSGFKWMPESVGLKKVELRLDNRTFTYNLEVKKPAEILKWWPDKLILPSGGRGTGTVVLKSNLNRPQHYTLRLTRITGINEEKQLWDRAVTLAAGELKEIAVEWEGGKREYGRELRLSIRQNGRVVDESSEYTTLGDDYTRLVQLTVANAGWFHINGQQNWFIPSMRRGYTGTMEYYVWAPDQQYDLTPEKEVWEPHTESNAGSYRTTISKSFLKGTIALAHKNGLKVVAELNGMASLPRAMEHPEELIYTADGQPWIYIRKVYPDGAEFAVFPRDYYTEKRVRAWADEMGASIKMFGWDGVRFDCGFLPVVSTADPLYAARKTQYKQYTWDGKDREKLYNDPDETAARLTNIWRTRTREYKPSFRYLTNFSRSLERQKIYPKYTAAQARDAAYLLFENLLAVHYRYKTIKEWVAQLRSHGQNVRELGAEPAVGWMRGGPPGYSSLMHWIAFASGYHMYAWAGSRNHPVDTTWKEYRFALRYAEYLYAPDMQWLPLDQADLTVTPDKGIMWKNFVYKRELEGGKTQYIVDLLNLPEDKNKDQIYINHPPASPKKNLRVIFNTFGKTGSVKAYLLLPEPKPHTIILGTTLQGGKWVANIDKLHQFAILVMEIAR